MLSYDVNEHELTFVLINSELIKSKSVLISVATSEMRTTRAKTRSITALT